MARDVMKVSAVERTLVASTITLLATAPAHASHPPRKLHTEGIAGPGNFVGAPIAHSFGADHELLASDPMSYLDYPVDRSFQDRLASCGEDVARPCGTGAADASGTTTTAEPEVGACQISGSAGAPSASPSPARSGGTAAAAEDA